ncbi:hypothetical protein PsYK624_131260 [Phanerochaete sordida]|uniref:Uncharacterized protein n=1 Tax=Phanerochaete sordida TaxID=48140 RepID=A0A9P3GJ88_9APHY|nr:hypothetical protein PsYK624_131260 [Phanerochaete sordida]
MTHSWVPHAPPTAQDTRTTIFRLSSLSRGRASCLQQFKRSPLAATSTVGVRSSTGTVHVQATRRAEAPGSGYHAVLRVLAHLVWMSCGRVRIQARRHRPRCPDLHSICAPTRKSGLPTYSTRSRTSRHGRHNMRSSAPFEQQAIRAPGPLSGLYMRRARVDRRSSDARPLSLSPESKQRTAWNVGLACSRGTRQGRPARRGEEPRKRNATKKWSPAIAPPRALEAGGSPDSFYARSCTRGLRVPGTAGSPPSSRLFGHPHSHTTIYRRVRPTLQLDRLPEH